MGLFLVSNWEKKKENYLKLIFYYDISETSLMEDFKFQFENNIKPLYIKEGKTLEVEYIKKGKKRNKKKNKKFK